MRHGKSMDIETVFETCLIKYSPIRGTDLHKRLRERGVKLSRSQFYRYAAKFDKSGKLERTNGIYYYQKPQDQQPVEEKAEECSPLESERDKAKAISKLKSFEAMTGYKFSRKDWNYVLNQNDGKRMLDKAEALVSLRRRQALF